MNEQVLQQLKTIKAMKSRDYWQKFCASEDWFEKDFQYVVKHIINQNATYRRKQWECATIFLNLLNYGMLEGDKVGAAFGAGREKLLFKILPLTDCFYATDVYSMNTVWSTANVGGFAGPEEFVKAAAPADVETDNLRVYDMDMRDLSQFEDNSLDFCYSSCAFEHIGHREDFISHLKEVRRVLKPGGIYSMTTEFLFNTETKPIKGNYKFDIEYLRELFIESGLDTAELFDGQCEPNLINWPKPPVDSLSVKKITNLIPTPFLYLEGIPYSTCNFVLSPAGNNQPKTFSSTGLENTAKLLTHRVMANIKTTFSDWQLLDPYNRLRREVKNYMEDHRDYLMEDGFELNLEENLKNGLLVYTDFLFFADKKTNFRVFYDISEYSQKIEWLLVEKDPMKVEGRKTIQTIKTASHGSNQVNFEFTPNQNKVYALSARVIQNSGNLKVHSLQVWVKCSF